MSFIGNSGVALVAVIGVSCRLPGADNPAALWQMVREGRQAVRPLEGQRAALLGEKPGRPGGWLDDVSGFDAAFFGIPPREAISMDPQQRLALELTHHAFESAGLDRAALKGSRTGVFVGTIWSDYAVLLDARGSDHHDLTGVARGMVANRLSHTFGLRGPSMAVDTGQSSSLVAVHLAAESLRNGEADIAVAGGVNLILTPVSTSQSVAFGGISPTGRCHTFDERADGYVRGEGGAFVVLKRLDRAVLDGDPVLAVVAGSAVGNDGATDTLTTPSPAAQEDVIRVACARSGIEPTSLGYVELHGTGTTVGDPIEAAALGRTAGRGRPSDSPLLVGSIKTNVGHLEAAAGIVGLVKAVLALAYGELPASLNFSRPPASIPLAELGLQVQAETGPWPRRQGTTPRYAGVSSFGIGGTNCHLVVAEAPSAVGPRPPSGPAERESAGEIVPWVLSARSQAALAAVAERLIPLAGPERSRLGLAGALTRRDVYEHRAVLLAGAGDPTRDLLTALSTGVARPDVVTGEGPARDHGGPVLVFPGQGSQWVGMCQDLLTAPDPLARVFRDRLDACSRALIEAGGPDATAVLSAADEDGLDDLAVVQPVLWAVMVALAAVWEAAGVRPAAVLGHSQGEVAAAVVAGALSLAEGARVVTTRSAGLHRVAGDGGMVSVSLGPEALAPRLEGTSLVIAAVNSPAACIVSGLGDEVEALARGLAADDVRHRRIDTDCAGHSPAVDAVYGEVLEGIGDLAAQAPRVPWFSTVDCAWMTDEVPADARYWARNLREPVRFADGVAALLASGHTAFVECSPHPVLLGGMESTLLEAAGDGGPEPLVLPTLRRADPGVSGLMTALAQAWAAGIEVEWADVTPMPGRAAFPPYALPLYPFQHRPFWPSAGAAPLTHRSGRLKPTGGNGAGGGDTAESLSGSLDGLTPQARRSKILDIVRRTTAELLGHTGVGDLKSGATFRELGVDSVTLVELRSALGRAVGVRLPSVVLFDHPTPERIADWLLERSGADADEGDAGEVDSGEVVDQPAWAQAIPRAAAPEDDPVVVVGAACRFPGGIDTPEGLWEALSSGRDLLSGFPTDRGWPAELFDADPHATGRSSVDRGGFLTGASEFDAGFFGISPREATAMDPQQRVLLRCAWEAVERAGVDLREPATTGVFLGAIAQDYGPRMDRPAAGLDGYLLTGTTTSVVSGRVAYVMGLEGPALTVDTACSSSLVALHLAVGSLRAGECDRALVGGATVMASPGIFVEFSRQGGLAPDGRCKPFAAAADGTGWSEGAGVVLLERLSAARRAGHRVLAVVRGTAVNSDGASNGLSAPSGVAQQRVIRAALASAGVEARAVDAVEAHGTGTALGDPIEAGALLATYGAGREEPLSLGSAKSVLGHTQAAAGIAGLLATVLGFEHEELPATRHVDAPSPHVDWDAGALALRTAPRPWPRQAGRPRLAGVSAFSISGTNAHVILEEPPVTPDLEQLPGRRSAPMPWVHSAAERERLDVLTARLTGLPDDADAAPVAAALARRVPHRHRAVLNGVTRDTLALGTVSDHGGRGAVFVFPGQGAQWVGMGAELLAADDPQAEVFTHRLRECAAAVLAAGGPDVLAVLGDDDPSALDDVAVVQPASWAVMVSLAAVWESAGVAPAAVVGHSQGEIAAAVVAGALSVDDGARVVVARALALRSVAGTGSMASIAEPADAVRERLVGEAGIAAENAPGATVISGPVDDVAAVVAAAAEAEVRTRVLPVDYASHSPSMESLRPQVLEALNGVRTARPRVPWFSTTELGWIAGERPEDYWMDNLSRPVRFGAAIQALLGEGYGAFVETSPHPVLIAAIEETAEAAGHEVAATGTLRRDEGGPVRLLTALAQAWVLGVEVDWTGLLPPARVPADVPTYPFRADRYWAMPESRESTDPAGSGAPPAVPDPESARLWEAVDHGDVEALGRALELDERATLAEVVPRLGAWRRRRGDERRTDSWRYQVGWRPLEDRPPADADPLLLLLPAGEHSDVAALADALAAAAPGAAGHVVDVADPARDIADAVRAHRAEVVVSLLGLVATPDRSPVAPAVGDALTALRAVLDAARDGGPAARLWWVTRGGVSVEPPRRSAARDGAPDPSAAVDGPPDPWAAQLWGLGRVAALEHPRHWGGLVDLPGPDVPDPEGTAGDTATLAARLVAAIRRDDGEDQIAVRAAGTFGRRLWRAWAAEDPSADGAARFGAARFTARGTAIVTGGTGALGAHIARWLADAGAEHLVLVGRRGPDTDGAPELRAELEERGVRTSVVACDVTDPDAVAALVDRYPPDLVVHAAGMGALAPLAGLGPEEVEVVARAKVAGAQNLHAALGDRPLDGFVLFSSISAVWGVADHGAYAAANAHLDALAAGRAAAGLPALSVAWGPWSGGGMIAESLGETLARRGVPLIDPEPAVVALGRALALGDSTVAVAEVDWTTFAPVFTSSRPTRLLDDLPEARAAVAPSPAAVPGGAATAGDAGSAFGRRVAAVDADEGRRLVRALVRTELSAVLGYTGTDVVDGSRAFSELGVDSLGAVKLRRTLREATGVAMATTVVFDHPTPDRLADWLFGRLLPDGETDGETDRETPVTAPAPVEDDPVVIVAAACRFPGGIATPEQLWEVVAAGGDVTSAFPADRGWPADVVDTDPAAAGHSTVGRGGFLDGVGEFDAGFFGISPREATAMDPQQRVLLECAWEALERAGVKPRSLRGSRTGVYVGLADQDYARLLRGDGEAEGHLTTGAASSVASGRIAYVLGLEGPALTVDTACSSTLVALHLAARSLHDGECGQALVGGAMIMVNPDQFVRFSRQRALAPDGRCKPFAAAADGFALSEGAAVVMIERLSTARAAGHPVLAVLRGSAVNSDGASNGLSTPNGLAQQRVLRDALRAAGLGPADIDAVETHGTGTTLGDPIEASALLEVFGTERDEPLWIGSLKSNLGHTQSVAGLGGVIKTMLAMEHGVFPATVHVDAPSPHVAWESGAVELLTAARPWPVNGHPRRAGVSSFGISGTNAHVVLEEPPPPVHQPDADREELVPWPVSARGDDALAALALGLADHVERTGEPAGAVGAALVRRTAFEERAVVLALGDDPSGALDDLRSLAAGQVPADAARGTADTGARGVVFVFPGQGAQWVGMGRDLLGGGGRTAEVFAGRLGECSAAVVAAGGPDVLAVLGDDDPSALDDVAVVQPVSWAVMVALAAVWVDAGVVPAAVVGHSQGEIAAAVVAGALSVADGARVVVSRATALRSLAGTGAMASIAEPEDAVAARIARSPGAHAVTVAVVNGPDATVVSGPAEQVRDLVDATSRDGVRSRVLPVDYASHSPMVEELAFDTAASRAPDIRWYSTVHPGWVDAGLPGEYWAENLRQPVRFADAVGALLAEGFDAFVEVSAHPVLVAAIEETADAAGTEVSVTPTLRRGDGGPDRLLSVLAQAWTRGAAVDWSNFVASAGPVPVMPTYPFQRRRYWPERPAAAAVSGTPTPVDAEDASFWEAVERTDTEALTRALDVPADLVPALTDVVPALAGWRRDRERRARSAGWHHRLVWRPVELAPAEAPDPRPWLLVFPDGEGKGTAVSALRAALAAAGRPEPSVLVVGPDESRAELAERLRAATRTEPGAIVSTLGLMSRDPARDPAVSDLPASTDRTVTLVQALDDAAVGGPWWWLTHHAVSTTPREAPDAAQAQLWGLGLVVGLDHPDRWGGVLDLGSFDPADLSAAVGIVGGDTGEEQLAVRAGRVLVRRLVAAAPLSAPAPWRTSGTAVVTGGTGALGGQVARWLAHHGAEHLVLTSRRGPSAPGAAALADELRAGGVRVDLVACDLAGSEGRAALGAALAGHPVRTVVHAAGVVEREAPLAEQTVDGVAAMLAAKVGGAEYLDALFADTELDAFVLFSSGAATWGNVGGAGYAAANAHLDALAARRRAEGRPALSVAWGAWAAGGMVDQDTAAALLARGVREMAPDAALAALGSLLGVGVGPTAVVSDMDWARFADVYTASRARRLLDEHDEVLRIRAEARSSGTETADGAPGEGQDPDDAATGLRGRLGRAGSDTERVRIAVDVVRRTAAAALGHDQISEVGPRRSFTELGFESLTAVDFRNRLAVVTGVRLPATTVYDHPTPRRLAEHLLEQLGPCRDTADTADAAGPTGVLAALAALESALDLAWESGPGSAADEDLDAVANRLRRLADRHTDHRSGPDHTVEDLDAVSDDEMFNLIDEEFGAA